MPDVQDPQERSWFEAGASADAAALQMREWRPQREAVGGIYLLHGLGEHSGRYGALAHWLVARGLWVRAHDHRGHGASQGARGVIDHPRRFVADARAKIEAFAQTLGQPPLLLGHSMGGALAAELVVAEALPVAGLVLSAPALAVPIGAPMRLLVSLLTRLAPSLALGNGLDAAYLSHDAAQVKAYREDPLVHDRISPRLLGWLLQAGERARAGAAGLSVPALVLMAGDDRMVANEGAQAFCAAASPQRLSARLYEGLHHELFNELPASRAQVLADFGAWLDAHLPRV